MTDDRLERALSEAISDLAGSSTPDYLNDILERTSRTRQRPWWTFPRRYLSMTATLKFATAASLAFVLGVGVAPLLLPSNDGSAVGPSAAQSSSPQADAVEGVRAVTFSGRWQSAGALDSDDETTSYGDPVSTRGSLSHHRVLEMSDPRLDGEVTVSYNQDWYEDLGVVVYNSSFRIDNDQGAWVERPGLVMRFPDDAPSAKTTVLVGEGAYDGLIAIAEIDWQSWNTGIFDIRGVIVAGTAPPAPATAPAPAPAS